jgi:hypothetical protein
MNKNNLIYLVSVFSEITNGQQEPTRIPSQYQIEALNFSELANKAADLYASHKQDVEVILGLTSRTGWYVSSSGIQSKLIGFGTLNNSEVVENANTTPTIQVD